MMHVYLATPKARRWIARRKYKWTVEQMVFLAALVSWLIYLLFGV